MNSQDNNRPQSTETALAGETEPRDGRLREIARELRNETKVKYGCAWAALAILFFIPLHGQAIMVLSNTVMGAISPVSIAVEVLLMVGIILYLIQGFRLRAKFRQHFYNREGIQRIIADLATGSDRLANIFSYTPWPWRVFLGSRPAGLKDWLRLVGRNLDWYLAPPRLRLHWEWFFVPLFPVTLLASLITIPTDNLMYYRDISTILSIILIFQLMIPAQNVINRHEALTALLDAILARLDDDAKDEPDE